MPEPNPGETREDYLKRCIPIVLDEGTAQDQDQAAAICYSMWERAHEGESTKWLTIAQVRELCPSCADRMVKRGLDRIDMSRFAEQLGIKAGNIEGLAEHLAKRYGEDPGFFTQCMESEELADYDEETRAAICARAHYLAIGKWPGEKAGARHSTRDRELIAMARQKASEIVDHMIELQPDDDGLTKPMPPRMPAKAANMLTSSASAGSASTSEASTAETGAKFVETAIKAVGEWELDVLGVPYGSPARRDADGEYFSPRTKLHLDRINGKPAIVYYHGYDPKMKPLTDPQPIGEAVKHEERQDGHWWRVVLDRTSDLARRIWDAAKIGRARASSGAVAHLVRKAPDGEILNWPIYELSLIDVGERRAPANQDAVAIPAVKYLVNKPGVTEMDETNDIQKMIQAAVAAQLAEREKTAQAEAERQAEIKRAVDAAVAAVHEEEAAKRRLPSAAYVARFGDEWKFDNYSSAELMTVYAVLNAQRNGIRVPTRISKPFMKALARRCLEGKSNAEQYAAKALIESVPPEIKSDEIMQQDLTSYGDEWVGVGYGTVLWEMIRNETVVLNKIPSYEVPKGQETINDPTEGADPTWYLVAEATDINGTMGTPAATYTSSKVGTGKSTATLAKIGARVLWSGELDEDSLLPMAGVINRKLVLSGAEQLEHLVIDGDTNANSSQNINDIASAVTPGALYLALDGFRKLALVTNTANSRSAGGGLSSADFIETVKLMGTAGADALDVTKVSFIIDLNTAWASLQLSDVKTRDVFSQPTLENGRLKSIWGYEVIASPWMHYTQSSRKANSAGKIDLDTASNNAYGAILAVRWDRWLLGWKRRVNLELTRYAASDVWEVTANARLGLKYYSTEASAITYYVGV